MRLYFFILGVSLASIFTLNAWLDVSGVGTFDSVYRMAGRQRSSELLVWENLFDQRAWLKATLARRCPEILVLGSSTVGAFRQDWFDDRTMVNGWMAAPTIEDFEAATAMLEQSRCAPRHIIVGIDHWLLNARFTDERWTSVTSDFMRYQARHGRIWLAAPAALRLWDTFKERLSFVTTRESLSFLLRWRRGETSPSQPMLVDVPPERFCPTIPAQYYIRSYDGHYTLCSKFASPPPRVTAMATNYVTDNRHQVREWQEVDAMRMARLERVLSIWRRNGSAVVVLATPFHPLAYQRLTSDALIGANLRAMDASLQQMCDRLSAHFVNLRDPERTGCSADEFEDSHHVAPSCAHKIADTLLATYLAKDS